MYVLEKNVSQQNYEAVVEINGEHHTQI